jgi:hypothetical protein
MSTELVRLDDEVGQAIRRPRQLGVPLIAGSASHFGTASGIAAWHRQTAQAEQRCAYGIA